MGLFISHTLNPIKPELHPFFRSPVCCGPCRLTQREKALREPADEVHALPDGAEPCGVLGDLSGFGGVVVRS